MKQLSSAVLVLAMAVPAFSQVGYPRMPGRGTGLPRPVPDIGQQPKKDKTPAEPLANFSGTVRSADTKKLIIEDAESNTLQFDCTKKTRYYNGSKKIKASAIKPGDRVSVEGTRGPDGGLEAVNVRLERGKSGKTS